ncbi:Dystrophin-1-like Protein [Tribolium castaneum]|uniref:Dystrophin-1-like Protein n=1 Tax=Tribolium castaneum TaxID=7070 RepID=A0A139WEI7_TRICA|nr:Dystrophin-1-like Protein [Tribolium castaneum]
MQTTWKKLENENGFPFYFNESTKQKQWDHPKFIELKHTIDDWNYVKYSKYRVGLKFRALQKALFMEEVTLSTVMGVFAKHKLGMNESSLCLESYDLEAVLYDIFFAANKRNNKNIDVDFAVELMQNFLYNIYDKERQVKIQVSSTKLALALLSDCELSELYNFIFSLCADHNNCVTRLRLQSLLTKLVEIMVFMHEDVSFGQHLINSTIEHCFSNGIHREFSFRFIKKLCGLMPCSVKLNETDRGIVETKAISSEKDFLLKPSDDFYSNIGTLSSPHTQLQLIIRQLEIQNRELHRILVFGTHNEKEIRKYLEEHKVEVATQIHKLKILKEYLHVAPPQKTVHESTPMVGVVKYPKRDLESALSPIIQSSQTLFVENPTEMTQDSLPYSVNDISTWIKDQPTSSKGEGQVLGSKSPVRELHNDLDDALAKLQQILANNFTLDESLGAIDNNHLKHAVSEVEGMLTSFIDNVESSRASSVQ